MSVQQLPAGQKAGILALAKAPRGEYVYLEGHTSALCNTVGGNVPLVDRLRIKNRWHYRLTPRGWDAAAELQESPQECRNITSA